MSEPRVRADADGLGNLVVAVLDILRDLIERQALRRVDGGTLTDEEIERLGRALLDLNQRFEHLRQVVRAESGPRTDGAGSRTEKGELS